MIKVGVDADKVDNLTKKFRKTKAQVESMAKESERAMKSAVNDTAELDKEINRLNKSITEMNREIGRTGNKKLLPRVSRDKSTLARLMAIRRELQLIDRTDVDVKIDVKKNRLGQIGRSITSGIAEAVGGSFNVVGRSLAGGFRSMPPQVLGAIVAVAGTIAAAFIGALAASLAVLAGGGGVLAGAIAGAFVTDDATKKIDAVRKKLGAAKDELKSLREEYAKTGDKDLLPDIKRAQKDVSRLTNELNRTKDALKDIAVTEAFRGLMKDAKEAFSGMFDAVRKPLVLAFKAIGDNLKTLKPQFTELGEAVKPILGDLVVFINEFVKAALPGFKALVEAAQPLFDTLAEHGDDLGRAFTRFAEILKEHGPTINKAFESILEIAEWALPALATALAAASYAWVQFVTIISTYWEASKAVLEGVVAFFKWLWGSIVSIFSGGTGNVLGSVMKLAAIPAMVNNFFAGMVAAVVSQTAKMMSTVMSIPGKVKGALGNLGGLLVGAGRSLINGLINGIKGAIGRLKATLGSVTRMIPSWKGPEPVDRKLLTPNGEMIMGGLLRGIDNALPALRSKLQGVTREIPTNINTSVRSTHSNKQEVSVNLNVTGGSRELVSVVRQWARENGRGDIQFAR